MSPFQAVYGRPPPSLPCYTHGSIEVPAVDKMLGDHSSLIQQLKRNLASAHNRMKEQADKHRRNVEYTVGSLVLVKLQPYRQQSLAQRGSNKLSKRFFGPYKILERVGPVAYRLELPESSKIHPVFHVSLLKAWVGSPPDAIPMLPELSINNQPVMLPSSILNSRIVLRNGAPEKQILVQWRDRPTDESSWEPLLPLARLFPSLDLEGKVSFDGMGSDTNQMS
ncbi:unnamed protein product [Rhodiola kirilowii]